MDVQQRLEEAGFQVRVLTAANIVQVDSIYHMGLNENEPLFLCEKGPEPRVYHQEQTLCIAE